MHGFAEAGARYPPPPCAPAIRFRKNSKKLLGNQMKYRENYGSKITV
jgi:hypothetical protein